MNIRRDFLELAHKVMGKMTRYNAWQQFQFLSQSQWWPLEKLEEYRWAKLKKTITHAYKNIPFYQELWKKHGVCPEDIKKADDVKHIPIVNREDIIDRDQCLARQDIYPRGISTVTTSGSTGEPFSVYIDLPAYQLKYALWLREFSFADCHLGKKIASFWHRSYRGYMKREPHAMLRDIIWTMSGKKIFPPLPTDFDTVMDHKQGLLFYEQLRDFHPFLMESLYYFTLILTDFILDNNLAPIPLSKMFMHGKPSGKERQKVEKAFSGVEIFNRYSSHEFEGIACACSAHSGMHISIDSYFVEFIREDNSAASPGEIARIIITDLDNKAMPLIRYEIRDMAWYIKETCPCGRGLPLMSDLAGRKNEYIITADGQKRYFSFFHDFFDRYEEVRYFQIHQNGRGVVEAQIVKDHAADANTLSEKISEALNAHLGTGVLIKYVEGIREEKNGKILPVKRIH